MDDAGSPTSASAVDADDEVLSRLATERILGVVFTTDALIVERSLGSLCEGFRQGYDLRVMLPVFQGLEPDLEALRLGSRRRLGIPNVSITSGPVPLPKSTIYLFARDAGYLVVFFHAEAEADLERELTRQVKARRIAEQGLRAAQDELVRKAELIGEQNRELTAINGELEQFCSIISHDLSTPLRAIRQLCGTAADDNPANAAAVGAALQAIRDKSEFMSRMIRDLIDYATIGRRAETASEVDTRALVEHLAGQLVPPSDYVVTISGAFPLLRTYRPMLELVQRNLIANAVLHHDRGGGRIDIDGWFADDCWCFSIGDDGPGIVAAAQQSVFRPFLRGGTASAGNATHEGQGIGLAQVKRAVEVNGGTIVLSSDPPRRRGTRFIVRWPAAAAP